MYIVLEFGMFLTRNNTNQGIISVKSDKKQYLNNEEKIMREKQQLSDSTIIVISLQI